MKMKMMRGGVSLRCPESVASQTQVMSMVVLLMKMMIMIK